jgi:type VI secretion system protein ImpC
VEIGNAIVVKELPFVMGVMADLSGMPTDPLPPMKLRKFVEVDRDNFPEFMLSISPRLSFQVKNTLGDGVDGLSAELFFKHIDDFSPISIAQQVPKLSKIYNSRIRLNDLVVKLEGNDVLQSRLREIVENADLKAALKQQIDALLKANKQTITADFATTLGSAGSKDAAAAAATPPPAGATPNGAAAPTEAAKPAREILKELFTDGKLARDPGAEVYACNILIELLAKIEAEKLTTMKNALTYVERLTADIDAILSTQISEILHHPAFQTLEGTWRALYYLVMNTDTGAHLKIRVMNATKKELLDDLEHTIEFDQSQIFKKVYEEEYGTFGGHPYSCLIGGYEFTRSAQDLILLEKMSNVAAAAHAPFIAAAHSKLFDMDSFAQLAGPRDISKIFESTEMMKWNSFRDSEDSRYAALVMPKILMRLPYGPDTLPVEGINYVESVDGSDSSQFCWGNAAFVLAQRIGNAFSLYKWPAAIRGVEGGGLVESLPAYMFKTTDGDIALKCPTEIAITDRREKELSDMGFLVICHSKGTDFAAFFGGQTVQRPKVYNTDDANANAALSARLPYLLAASRFAHYIKSIMRDKIGSFLTKENVSFYLNNWIADYVLLNDSASQTLKAKYPLREARIDVFDVPGKPGSYKATIFLRPHFQLEELTASIRLVATLPPPASG